MAASILELPVPARPVLATLLPIMAVVLVGFLVIGLALPVLPLHVTRAWASAPSRSAS
ncbi:MAG TPA: hypothetical protein VM684_04315 [Gaiellales bacterium]|nr:hypothetical protein [Gaiellales bacterium]